MEVQVLSPAPFEIERPASAGLFASRIDALLSARDMAEGKELQPAFWFGCFEPRPHLDRISRTLSCALVRMLRVPFCALNRIAGIPFWVMEGLPFIGPRILIRMPQSSSASWLKALNFVFHDGLIVSYPVLRFVSERSAIRFGGRSSALQEGAR